MRSDLEDHLYEIHGTTADEWERLRGEIDQAMEDVENTMRELSANL